MDGHLVVLGHSNNQCYLLSVQDSEWNIMKRRMVSASWLLLVVLGPWVWVLQFPSDRKSRDRKKGLWISELPGASEAVGVECFIGEKLPSFIWYKSVYKCTKLWLVNNVVCLEVIYVLQGCIMIMFWFLNISWCAVLDVNPWNKQKDTFLNVAWFILYLNQL